jgi:hypothetical protein
MSECTGAEEEAQNLSPGLFFRQGLLLDLLSALRRIGRSLRLFILTAFSALTLLLNANIS